MDFRLNEEQELFVAGIKEYMTSRNWDAILQSVMKNTNILLSGLKV